jgi:hypothetical protein
MKKKLILLLTVLSIFVLTSCKGGGGSLSVSPSDVTAAPELTIYPNEGAIAGGTTVTITGKNFESGVVVSIGGEPCTSPTVLSSTTLTCTSSAHSAGNVDVIVTKGAIELFSMSNYFTYVNPPNEPSSLTLFAGDTSSTPTITVSGVASGQTIKRYKDSGCTSLVASGVASGETINLTTSSLSTYGIYHFYAKAFDKFEQTSSCSSAFTISAYYSFISIPQNKTGFTTIANNSVNGVVASNGVIYAGTNGGLSISTDGGASFTNKTTISGLGSNLTRKLFVDSSGKIYAATSGGLSISNGGASFTNKTASDGLGSSWVNSVYVDSSGVIFAATNGGISISTNFGVDFSNLTTSQGLGSNTVRDIYVDSAGAIYTATPGGLPASVTP